jgi:hypothetical protein
VQHPLCTNIIPNVFGLPGPDCAYGVATCPDGTAYVVGCMANPAGTTSAFVARVAPDCNILCVNIIRNVFGVPGPDCAYGVATCPDCTAYVVGWMTNPTGLTSAFVSRVAPNCNVLCTNIIPNVFGLPGPDCAYGVSVDQACVAYVVGCMENPAGTTSAFVARVTPNCDILCVTIIPNLYGLPGPDCAYGVAVGPDGLAYEVGCMANPFGFSTAFVSRATPHCKVLCVNKIPNVFGL